MQSVKYAVQKTTTFYMGQVLYYAQWSEEKLNFLGGIHLYMNLCPPLYIFLSPPCVFLHPPL